MHIQSHNDKHESTWVATHLRPEWPHVQLHTKIKVRIHIVWPKTSARWDVLGIVNPLLVRVEGDLLGTMCVIIGELMKAPPRLRKHRIHWTAEEKAIVFVVWARTRTKERVLPGVTCSFFSQKGNEGAWDRHNCCESTTNEWIYASIRAKMKWYQRCKTKKKCDE